MSYDSYLYQQMEDAYGEAVPDDITDYECCKCGVVIGKSEFDSECESDDDGYLSWKVWHLNCNEEDQL